MTLSSYLLSYYVRERGTATTADNTNSDILGGGR